MPSDSYTDIDPRIRRELEALRESLDKVEETADQSRSRLIEICGVSGRNGRCATMREKLDRLEADNKETRGLVRENRALILKLLLATAGAGAAGTTAANLLLKVL